MSAGAALWSWRAATCLLRRLRRSRASLGVWPQCSRYTLEKWLADEKPQCDYVCAATCDQDAVSEVIERFVLV